MSTRKQKKKERKVRFPTGRRPGHNRPLKRRRRPKEAPEDGSALGRAASVAANNTHTQ